jgi:multidrug efflux pump subunit AcrA (membrane-fusion protein)
MSTDVDLRQLAIDRGGQSAQRPPLRTRRHLLTRYVLPLVLLLGFAALVAWAARDLVFPPRPVTVVPVLAAEAGLQREGTPLFKAAGWVEPRPTPIRAAALAPGVVERLLVVEDQQVKQGEPVAELVKADAQLAHDRATADLTLRQAELSEAEAALRAATTRFEQPVHLEAMLGEAEAALAAIETQLKNLPFETRRAVAQAEFARKDYEGKLASQGAVAGRAVDEAESIAEAAEALVAELKARTASLEQQRSGLVQRRDALRTQLALLADETKARDEAAAKVAAAKARVEQARVMQAEAMLRLDRMTVRAPVDGRVYQLIGAPGTTLAAGMGPAPATSASPASMYDGSTVVTLYQPQMLQVRCDVRFDDLPKVSLAQPVRIENPALAEPLDGRVLFISSVADIQKNTLQVKVGIESPPPVFKPEMLVDATFLAPRGPEKPAQPSDELRLYLPEGLVQRDDGGAFVWVADQAAGVARRVRIETSATGGNGLVEVTRGLTVSSRIIVGGAEGLTDGMRVRVTGEEANPFAGAAPQSGGLRGAMSRLPPGGHD